MAYISLVLIKQSNKNLTLFMILFFSVAMFAWYIYTSSSSTFDAILSYGDHVLKQMDQFFNPTSREQAVLRGLGLETPPSIWNAFSRGFAYLTEIFIVLGFFGLITKQIGAKCKIEYIAFIVVAMVLLVALIIVPGLANTLNMSRFYHILLFFLAPLCLLGIKSLIKLITKQESHLIISILLLIVLIPYFLFQINFVYEVTRTESWSLSLSMYRMGPYRLYARRGYIDTQSVLSAQWVRKNINVEHVQIYSDISSIKILISYGNIYRSRILLLSNVTKVSINGIVYLNQLNTVHKIIVTRFYLCASDELIFLRNMNKIYTNGGSDIYQNSIGD
jgi:uncharacterized membrane protein